MRYERILRAVAADPWAIDPRKGRAIVEFLAFAASGGTYAEEERAARIGSSQARAIRRRSGSTAIIPLHGVMAQRVGMLEASSGGVGTEQVQGAIAEAVADDSVKTILLHVDSPGGSIYGVRELAGAVREAKKAKPVIAQIDSLAASAAYWVASQATEVNVTPGGDVGSIGIYAMHEDLSKALEQEGVGVEFVSAGKYKLEGNPTGPLGDDARGHWQSRVDAAYRDFVADVAKGRGVSTSTVEESYGQGRLVTASAGLSAGMVDRISTFDATLNRYARSAKDYQRNARAASALAAS